MRFELGQVDTKCKDIFMTIDVEKLQKLSNLEVADKDKMQSQLESILGYVENLNELDTDGVDSTFSTLDGGTPTRKDEAKHSEISKDVLQNAPKAQDDFFIVPNIIQ
jgi:aspartyl-tRNA(Asn)/glutamyl-tRNA(Gln) amidotransferase subunit C